ncbi:MAG: hypothetical protein CMG80_04185 [Marinobacter sp.]|nr:hypothetical protein [Marinobacter sp.]
MRHHKLSCLIGYVQTFNMMIYTTQTFTLSLNTKHKKKQKRLVNLFQQILTQLLLLMKSKLVVRLVCQVMKHLTDQL